MTPRENDTVGAETQRDLQAGLAGLTQLLGRQQPLEERALTSRAVIDQAIGIIMSRTGADAEEAFAQLRGLSQTGNVKVAEVARQLVDQAVARARSRRGSEH